MAEIKKEDVLTYLESANMLEISELIKDIEDNRPVYIVPNFIYNHDKYEETLAYILENYYKKTIYNF